MMAGKLKKGDSGAVSQNVKRQMFVDALGICAAPKCNNRLMESRTNLGECAHIIPRKADSHPRGLEEISEEDRNKEPNLIYLCQKHHDIIDNVELAEFYPANTLRKWKKDHEAWAAGITKTASYLSKDIKDMLAGLETQIAEQAQVSEKFIKGLFSACHDLLNRHLINEASAFLSQIDILLLDIDDATLNAEADFLGAILVARNEKTPEAKEQLLEIIRAHPNYIEPMLEYIELCGSAPEPIDELEKIEKLARAIDADHPNFLLIDLSRRYKNGEQVKNFDIKTDNVRLGASLLRWHSLFCDMAGKTKQRDALVDKWQEALPNSPSPHHYRVAYKTMDIRKDLTVQADSVLDALEFSKQEWQVAKNKDPLTPRGHMSWLLEDLMLNILYCRKSGVDKDLSGIRDSMVLRIDQCYFDGSVNEIVSEFLKHSPITPDQWRMIVGKIQNSNVAPSQDLIEWLFLHTLRYDELFDDLADFVKKYKHADLLKILQTINEGNAPEVAKLINAKNNSEFALILLQVIADYKVAVPLTELLEIDADYQENFLMLRLGILDMSKQDDSALDLINGLNLEEVAPFALYNIENILYRTERWDLLIRAALRLLSLSIDDDYKSQLHAKLAMAYLEQKDATNAVTYAELALKDPNHGEDNSRSILGMLVQALLDKGQADEACGAFGKYRHIKQTFELLGMEATCYLKTNRKDKNKKALSCILQAFEVAEVYDDKLYLSAFEVLRQLENAGKGAKRNKTTVKDGLFIKLDVFSNWFYIGGQEKSLGAESIEPGTDNYKAVIGKSVGDTISWPAKKYSGENDKHKILCVAASLEFLARRASEAMNHVAQLGNTSIRTIRSVDEKGDLDMSNAVQYYEEQEKPYNEFFETFIKQQYPFAFLCSAPGGIQSALRYLQLKETSFIHCNDGSQADINKQNSVAQEVLNGAPCFMEGLVALMLAESGLLEYVIKSVPNLKVSTSVIGLLREMAGRFDATSDSVGSADIVDGKFQFYPINKKNIESNRDKFFHAADLLDTPLHKVVGKTYPKSDKNLNNMLPNYFVDALRYAHEEDAHILTDDALFTRFYEKIEETPMPQHFSSLSLIRAMVDNGKIDSQRYYEYFGFLSTYRYHGLPLSPNDMMCVVLPAVGGGLVDPTPQNIYLLNLPLTLSQDYGVEAKTASAVLVLFFTALILNGSVTPQIADEIFTLTLAQALEKRDKKLMAKALRQGCHQNILNQPWINPISKQKLEMLDEQLFRMAALGVFSP